MPTVTGDVSSRGSTGSSRRTLRATRLTPRGHRETAYSITASARARSDGGTVRPSVLAVLRLMTLSNFVGCMIVQPMVDIANASGGRLFAPQPTGHPGSSHSQQ